MHDDNACCLCVTGICKFYFFSLVSDGSGVFFINTGQHLHKSGFSGSVFSHEGEHFTFSDFKIYMIKGMYTRERFVDPFHSQNNFAHVFTFYLSFYGSISFSFFYFVHRQILPPER